MTEGPWGSRDATETPKASRLQPAIDAGLAVGTGVGELVLLLGGIVVLGALIFFIAIAIP